MNDIDYWHGFQDALNLAAEKIEKVKGEPLGIIQAISKHVAQWRTEKITQFLEL